VEIWRWGGRVGVSECREQQGAAGSSREESRIKNEETEQGKVEGAVENAEGAEGRGYREGTEGAEGRGYRVCRG
jgi:hypothetical protein